jgi:hypothetical protein
MLLVPHTHHIKQQNKTKMLRSKNKKEGKLVFIELFSPQKSDG